MEDLLIEEEERPVPPLPKTIIVERFSAPTEWDQMPKGSEIRVRNLRADDFVTYVQRNSDAEKPIWEKI